MTSIVYYLKSWVNRKKASIDNGIKEIISNFAVSICHAESPERGNKRVGAGLHLWSVY